jgi:hypothetical protein
MFERQCAEVNIKTLLGEGLDKIEDSETSVVILSVPLYHKYLYSNTAVDNRLCVCVQLEAKCNCCFQ